MFSQSVTLSKGLKVHDNKDKFLYKIDSEFPNAEYLGEIEVEGFSKNYAETFNQIYKKAKTLGANAYSLQKKESIDDSEIKFNPEKYKLNLFYLPPNNFPKEENTVYIFSFEDKVQTIRINNQKVNLQPNQYFKIKLENGETNSISTKKILGSKVMLQGKENQPTQYYLISSFNVQSDKSGNNGGLFIKSGDITPAEKSFAQYLQLIYKQQN